MSWFDRIMAAEDDLELIAEAMEHYKSEYEAARKELRPSGRIDVMLQRLPGLIEHYWARYQELECILQEIEIRENKALHSARKAYYEHYNRQLTERMAEKYAENDDNVIALKRIRLNVAYVRNLYNAIFKGFESMNFRIKDTIELRKHQIEDATF